MHTNAQAVTGLLSRSSIVSANGTALAANRGRVGGFLQNLSTDKLYVKKGAGASTSDFSAVLVGGSATDDGYGGTFPFDHYQGLVSVFSSGTVRCVVSEEEA